MKNKDAVFLPESNYPRILIIGGGFAGLSMVEGLKRKDVQVVLIDRNNFHQFQPLLYQIATSALEPDSILFPFRKQFSGYKNVSFVLAEVTGIDDKNMYVKTDKGIVFYDYLVIASGTVTNYFGLKNIEKHSLGLKDIRDAINIRHKMLLNLEKAMITIDNNMKDALTNFVIVGGGPAGVEMAGALAEFQKFIIKKDYPDLESSMMKIFLLEASDSLLSTMSKKASSKTLSYLKNLGVDVILNEVVTDYDGMFVLTKSGKKILCGNLIWTAGVKGHFPRGMTDVQTISGNRIKTDEYLKVKGYENIFAMGDIAAMITGKTPKAHPQVAQAAIQQGRYLSKVLINIIKNEQVKAFVYKDKGSLATVGKHRAVADIGKFKFTGYFAWLLWSLVHLMSISGFKNKLLVGLNWAISYFSYEKSNRVLIVDYKIEK